MGAGQSGDERTRRAISSADELEAQGRELLARAQWARGRATALAKGAEGERVVGGLLDELADEGWVVLHDRRRLPSSPANIDHIAIGPGGVFVIDAKNWTGGRLRLDDTGMAVGRWRKDDELHSAKVDADIVTRSAAVVRPGLAAVGVVAFVQDMGLQQPAMHHDVLVLQQDQLSHALREAPPLLSSLEVSSLARHLAAAFPPKAGGAPHPSPTPRAPSRSGPGAAARPSSSRRRPPAARREPARQSARRQLVKVAVVLACLPAMPWAIEQVAVPVLQHVLADVMPAPPAVRDERGPSLPGPGPLAPTTSAR